MSVRLLPTITALVVLASACGSAAPNAPTPTAAAAPGSGETIIIDNQGGDLEGHTPRGFAGSGTGLFAGDELNPGFPADDGIQIWLSFDLPASVTAIPEVAELRSDALDPRSTPFTDLGDLTVAAVSYADFGPHLFNLESNGPETVCTRSGDNSLRCDVTNAVAAAIDAAQPRIQLRLRFDLLSDGDGQADLARFFLTDPNTNEPGIFALLLTP